QRREEEKRKHDQSGTANLRRTRQRLSKQQRQQQRRHKTGEQTRPTIQRNAERVFAAVEIDERTEAIEPGVKRADQGCRHCHVAREQVDKPLSHLWLSGHCKSNRSSNKEKERDD